MKVIGYPCSRGVNKMLRPFKLEHFNLFRTPKWVVDGGSVKKNKWFFFLVTQGKEKLSVKKRHGVMLPWKTLKSHGICKCHSVTLEMAHYKLAESVFFSTFSQATAHFISLKKIPGQTTDQKYLGITVLSQVKILFSWKILLNYERFHLPGRSISVKWRPTQILCLYFECMKRLLQPKITDNEWPGFYM